MIKFRIHGRGGQGGVTLAKLIAFLYWMEGKWVQAFGNYSAERTGAPILAFTLIDDTEITNRSRVYYPDHLIILDSTLIGNDILSGLQPGAYLIIDTPLAPKCFDGFPGHRVATVNAKEIALRYKLGTKTTPITNTAMIGAIAKVFQMSFSTVEKTIQALHFPEVNIEAARAAYDCIQIGEVVSGEVKMVPVLEPTALVPPLITGNLGTEPPLNVADWKSQEPFYAQDHLPPCNFHCPAGNNIQQFIFELTQGHYDEALAVLKQTSPLPGSTSRVCPHPCEEFCNRSAIDQQINIHALERLAADRGVIQPKKPGAKHPQKIAIIGSGPSGLSAAYHLQGEGFSTVIFESLPAPGGMLKAGIPDFRLPKDVLEKEIQFIVDSGVEIRCNSGIASKAQFQRLVQEYDAVIIAVGLSIGRVMDLGSVDSAPVMQGIEFLRKVNFGEQVALGAKVIVIGGGNTAIDASRTSLRLGAEEVAIVYRRSREEMPAIREEIEAAVQEGVNLQFLHAPIAVLQNEGKWFLRVQEMRLGNPGEDGRRVPVPVPNAYKELEFTTLILATGQIAGLEFLSDDIAMAHGFVKTHEFGGTSNKKVFATGDVVTNDGTVTHAIGEGRKVAAAVTSYLKGVDFRGLSKDPSQVITAEKMNLYYFTREGRREIPERPTAVRIQDFAEVNLGLDDLPEAFRCLSCGVCNSCYPAKVGKCQLFCPERTIAHISATKLSINYEGCKGCLICMEVCPRNAIEKRTVKKEGVRT